MHVLLVNLPVCTVGELYSVLAVLSPIEAQYVMLVQTVLTDLYLACTVVWISIFLHNKYIKTFTRKQIYYFQLY